MEEQNLHVLIESHAKYYEIASYTHKEWTRLSNIRDEFRHRILDRMKQSRHELKGLYAIAISDYDKMKTGDILFIHDNTEREVIATIIKPNGSVICAVSFDYYVATHINLIHKDEFDKAYEECLASQKESINWANL